MADFLSTQSYIGTRDFYPEDMQLRNWYFDKIRKVSHRFAYQEYYGPILESFDLFAAKSGDELVKEQVYHFYDKGERHLAIRPEMTPTVARMVAARLNDLRLPLRWFSIGNMMRYERPQKGRLREFYQLNVDLLGVEDTRADIEIMLFIIDLLKEFGADSSMFTIKVNNRRFFNSVVEHYLKAEPEYLTLISRAIDKKGKVPPEKYQEWLKDSGLSTDQITALNHVFTLSLDELISGLGHDAPGVNELSELFAAMKELGLSEYLVFDFSIVRGLDYYTGTVFEVFDLSPENNRALGGGGRYDNLVGLFKKEQVSGIGFGMGDVVFQDFLTTHHLIPSHVTQKSAVLITTFSEVPFLQYQKLAQTLHNAGIAATIYLGGSSQLKKQLQFAEKEMYPYVIVMGQDELDNQKLNLKSMQSGEQWDLSWEEAVKRLNTFQ